NFTNVNIEAPISLIQDGGAGADAIFANLLPAVQRGGMIDATFRGGPESDVIAVAVDVSAITPGSGRLHVTVDGDEGSDHLTLLDNGAEQPLENVLLTLDGGAGEDFAVAGALVQVV